MYDAQRQPERRQSGTQEVISPMQRELSGRGAYERGSLQTLDGVWYGRWRIGRKRNVPPTRTRSEPGRFAKVKAEHRLPNLTAHATAEHLRGAADARGQSHQRAIGGLGDPRIDPARDHPGRRASTLAACAMPRVSAGGRS
jgi:hypothetical protein